MHHCLTPNCHQFYRQTNILAVCKRKPPKKNKQTNTWSTTNLEQLFWKLMIDFMYTLESLLTQHLYWKWHCEDFLSIIPVAPHTQLSLSAEIIQYSLISTVYDGYLSLKVN